MKIGVVFPGQGSQRIGMGKDFYDSFDKAKEIFSIASESIEIDMEKICFEENEYINLTEYTQPAILTTEYAMYCCMQNAYSFKGNYFGGHSLGEYTALTVANVIPFKEAVKIVRKRGSLMQKTVPEGKGGMAALIHDELQQLDYQEIIKESGAEIANMNSKKQVVISGLIESIQKAKQQLEQKLPEIKFIVLNVSAPFHSSFMSEMEKEFKDYLQSFKDSFDLSGCENVVSNYSGTFYLKSDLQDSDKNLIDNLTRQISGRVNWMDNMKALAQRCNLIYEVGPNKHLTSFFQSMDVEVKPIMTLRSAERVFKAE